MRPAGVEGEEGGEGGGEAEVHCAGGGRGAPVPFVLAGWLH